MAQIELVRSGGFAGLSLRSSVDTSAEPTVDADAGWYAEQLARIPAPYRIVGCGELRQSARAVAERMLAASGPAPPS